MLRVLVLTTGFLLLTSDSAPATPFCRDPIARAVWSDEAQGSRIKVFPTGCGRRSAWLDPKSAFAEAIQAGGRTPVHRRSLYLQFRCHAYFAPVKRSWNLEAWRPVVSPKRLVKALCNPAGSVPHSFARRRSPPLIQRIVRDLQASVKRTVPVAGSAVTSRTRMS